MRRILLTTLLLILFAAVVLPAPLRVYAQAGTAGDLLAAVNALRADNGLPAYSIDTSLMASAQAHSDYQASIGKATHTRADGTGPADLGFTENIASGYQLGVQAVIDTYWVDDLHRSTLIGLSDGFAGAGVAERDGVVYYTLQVRRAPGASFLTPLPVSTVATAAPIIAGTAPTADLGIQTATALADGSTVHEVQPGQSVWAIALAYNVKINELIGLNQLAATPVIYAGQKLVIRQAFTPTVSPTITRTPRPPTRTTAPTRTPRPATAIPANTPTPTQTPFSVLGFLPDLNQVDHRLLGIGLIIVCSLGLVGVVLGALRKK